MSAARAPRELVAACMDHIALEGSAGIPLVSLFSVMEPSNDVFLHRQVWRLLRSNRGVLRFFRSATASPGKKRKRPGTSENNGILMNMKYEMLGAAESLALDENLTLTIEELELLTYEDAVATQQKADQKIMVVACEELRHRALNIPVKAIAADLGAEHFCILEAVGRARVQGVTVITLTNLLSGGTVKRLHNCLDTLISCGLVVKRMMIVVRPTIRRLNIIHLPRFAAKFRPQMFDESADFESDEQSRKILCAAAETYLKGLPTHSSVLSDLGRDLSLHKRHLEVLRSHIIQECKVDENFPLELFQAVLQPSRRARIEPKILNCVRYKLPNTCKTVPFCRGIVIELGLLHQIYGLIEGSAANGVTIIDLRNRIVLPGSKLPYKLVGVLAGMYNLKAESVILGKNKAFRLYLDSMAPSASNNFSKDQDRVKIADTFVPQASQSTNTANEVTAKAKMDRHLTVRANKALKATLKGFDIDVTSARRRKHILERLEDEKIISLSSLRDSVFGMEKQRAEVNTLTNSTNAVGDILIHSNANGSTSLASIGRVDTRSILRLATELEIAKKLRLLQLPLPARNVSTKFRALRCVVAPGYEHNDVFIQGFVKNYCRDERLRRIHRNADQSEIIRFHKIDNEKDKELEHKFIRKRLKTETTMSTPSFDENKKMMSSLDRIVETRRASDATCHASDIGAAKGIPASHPRNEICYRIRRFVSQQKSGIHNQQFRKLGFAYGVMFRCKALHRFLWDALHKSDTNLQLLGDENDALIQNLNEPEGECSSMIASRRPSSPGVVFSRESILHAMPVHLYIQIFSGGGILTDAEFAIVEEAVTHLRTFEAIPVGLREKIWCHESERTAKVLGTLADLGLIQPHKIGMKHLVKILRAGYTDGRDGVLSRALKDNALGGLFRLNQQVRIMLDDRDNENKDAQNGTGSRSVNEFDFIRVVGFTEKTYSFVNTLPLTFLFETRRDVDRFWEALECLCLEQMAMEVENPRKNEPAVREVPKPIKTRARRMLRILAWIPKSQKPVAKNKRIEESDESIFKSSGIVSTICRPRKKRRRAESDGEGNNSRDGVKRKRKKKHCDMPAEDQSKSPVLTWLDEHEQLLIKYFIDNCKSRWKVPIPQGLQRENEQVALRNHNISRSGFGLVAIARKLGKRKIDVKKRLKEKLMEPAIRLAFENAKREAELVDNPSGLFDEEIAIQESTRMTALFRRAVMMIMSPREEYHPLIAEELISLWTPQEIRLVWRYLWLKNWIVRASEKERGRGYSTSKKLQDSLKVNTLSYPLLLFQQAAEQESMVSSTLEEIAVVSKDAKKVDMACVGAQNSDQLFEDDFPANATPGQCALELGCQVLGTCSLSAVHSSGFETDAEFIATPQKNGKRAPIATTFKRGRFLPCKTLKDRCGFSAHLANKVNVSKASDLTDSWRVETKMNAVTIEDADHLSACEAFSLEDIGDDAESGLVTQHFVQISKEADQVLSQAVVAHVRESGDEGLTMLALLKKIRKRYSEKESSLHLCVAHCVDALVEQGVLIGVNAYYDQRYIVKEYGDVWMLRPFSLVPSTASLPAPKLLFEEENDTLSFPWLKMGGGTNYTFLFSIQRKLLALIIQAPGITEKRAYTKMGKLLTLQDTREAMSLLVEDGLVYARAVINPASAQVASLFGSSLLQPSAHKVVKLVGNVLIYDRSVFQVHYFPHIECIQRFGSIVQDYQND